MPFFNKNKVAKDEPPKKTKKEKKNKELKAPKVKKKTKIGFRHKKKEKVKKNKKDKFKPEEFEVEQVTIPEQKSEIEIDAIEDITEILPGDEEAEIPKKETQWTATKKKKIFQTDLKGKPVYLEDTGEKLGTVFDIIYDSKERIVGYKIKDNKSETVLSFPVDQFDESKEGLIFVQSWYSNVLKTLEKLEFKEKVSPELTTLISDDEVTNEELYDIFVKHDDEMVDYIDEAASIKKLLSQRLRVLEKQRLALKDDLMDLTERRLIKDIDRREFSEDVMAHRRKVNVLDVNINKCKDLLKRLNATSFGRLGNHITNHTVIGDKIHHLKQTSGVKGEGKLVMAEEIENPYKQKYNDIKERFDQLQEEYNELKSAVEKLISKGEI